MGFREIAAALTPKPRKREDRTGGYRLMDNLMGIDDGVDTPGERLGKGINVFGQSIADDPVGTLGSVMGSVEGDLRNLMFEGGARERPQDVMGYAMGVAAPGALAKAPKGALRAGMAGDKKPGIKAYHGSPHDFDKFSMDKIGTGEGAQAYGHGLYFAENEKVARGYRDALRWQGSDWDDPRYVARFWLDRYKGDSKAAASYLEDTVKHQSTDASKEAVSQAIGILNDGGKGLDAANPGSMYEVNINANPDDFLDWDAPLSAQSPKVRDAATALNWDVNGEVAPGRPYTGADLGRNMADEQWQRAALENGIPGIKYRDAGSRGLDGETGTRNYVVFDENLINIVRKYGIAGAAAMLGVSASDVEAAMSGEQTKSEK